MTFDASRFRRLMRSFGAVALPLGMLGATALGATPAHAAGPAATVTPSTGLANAQAISIDGTGWPPTSSLVITECQGTAAAPPTDDTNCDASQADTSVVADVSGNFTDDTPAAGYHVHVFPSSTNKQISCDAANACVLFVGVALSDFTQPKVFKDITFATPAPPTVTLISPNTGPTSGGTVVTITGTNLAGATAVKFGANSVGGVGCKPTSCTVTSPAATAGAAHVTVTTAGGTSATTAADQFTYVPPAPTVTSINPTSGPAAGSTPMTIAGTNLTGGTVKFGANAATGVSCTATSCAATSPAGAGVVDVTVTTGGGTSAISNADKFSYAAAAPTVTGISPTTGPSTGSTPVTVTGTNLAGGTVAFGANAATGVSCTATSCATTSPAGTGVVDVTVTTGGGTSATSNADKFTYTAPPAPTVTGISPTTGPTTGSTPVTVTGTNLTGGTVAFGANAATGVSCTATSCAATSPAGSGVVDVIVTTGGGTSATSNADKFTYTAPAAPTVTGIGPTSGPSTGSTPVTVTGTNLAGGTVVFGANAATGVSCTATSCAATSPAGSGVVDVTVTTGGGTSATSNADKFTYTAAGPPSVSGVSPSSGLTTGGTPVTVNGSNLAGGTVKFGANAATAVTCAATSCSATSPPGTGTVDVTVTTGGGTSPISSADRFTYVTSSGTGLLRITDVVPGNAQSITFTFGIFCQGVTGSPFVVYVTGSATSQVVGVPAGSQCLASETHQNGFVDQPNQSYQPAVGGQVQTLTFNQVAQPANSGSLRISDAVPAGSENVTFSFGIYCQGVTGSPFTVNITGNATSQPVVVAPGSQCLASETQHAGFVAQPNQSYQPVVAGATQTLGFTQVAQSANSGLLQVTDSVPAGSENVTFTFGVYCQGVTGSPFTVNITGNGTSQPVVVPAGSQCLASESHTTGFADQPNQSYAPMVAGTTQTATFTQQTSP